MRKIVLAATLIAGISNTAEAKTCAQWWQDFRNAYDVMRDEANDHPNSITPLFTAEWRNALFAGHQIEAACDMPDKAGFHRQLQAMERGE